MREPHPSEFRDRYEFERAYIQYKHWYNGMGNVYAPSGWQGLSQVQQDKIDAIQALQQSSQSTQKQQQNKLLLLLEQ